MPPPDFSAAIASLRSDGADRFDPVRLHYLDVLAQRTLAQPASVRRILEGRLAQALAAFQARFAQAHGSAKDSIACTTAQHPQAQAELQRLLQAGDLQALGRRIATLETSGRPTPLAGLINHMAQHAPEQGHGGLEVNVGQRSELKTMRYFRNTWSKLSVEKQVARALDQAPRNAGPINSHMLVVRSLALMREISPDYLNRYMSYVDTLLCLDQGGPGDKKSKPVPKKPPVVKAAKK